MGSRLIASISYFHEESTVVGMSTRKEVIKELISYTVRVGLVLVFIRACVLMGISVESNSMYPTVKTGDRTIGTKIAYYFRDPEYRDIIVFWDKTMTTRLFKRVIGVPGDTIEFKDESVILNGEVLNERYTEGNTYADFDEPITLGENEYFVMGDNREHSTDSRVFGVIQKQDIIAKVICRVWPKPGLIDISLEEVLDICTTG